MMDVLALGPLHRAAGIVRLPGSKSISNRTLLLAALAEGATVVRGLLEADDTSRMLDALAALGIDCLRQSDRDHWLVQGCGGRIPARRAELFLGNAGTAFRPLTAVLAMADGEYRLSGIARMHERPIGDLVDALRAMGAAIDYLSAAGFPPLAIHPTIHPSKDNSVTRVTVRGNVSSQFLTALLIALPLSRSTREICVDDELVSKPYVEITLNLMRRFGVTVERDDWRRFMIAADARYHSPGAIDVEGDASSASYFLAAGAIGGGPVRVDGVGRNSIQGDVRFAEVLQSMGARITMGDDWIEARSPPIGSLTAFDGDCNHIPDAAMTLAVTALFARGVTTLRNIASWRVKETDRIAAMANELRKLGARVDAGDDCLSIEPPATLNPATIDTYDDHRMAMSLSLAAFGGCALNINDPGCVGKTFPTYFDALARITDQQGTHS